MTNQTDIMAILKAVSCKLSNGNIAILAFMYHTEIDPSDPAGKKKDRSKSQYRYEGLIISESSLQDKISKMKADPDSSWHWPNLDTWRISYDNEPTNKRGAKWLEARLKKTVDWPTFEKLLNGWKQTSNDYKDSRKYEIKGYTCSDGSMLDITKETLESLTSGSTFSKILTPKHN